VEIATADLLPHSSGGGGLTLGDSAIDVWLAFDAQFPAAEVAALAGKLSPQEIARMHRLALPAAQRQFAITRALQRHALSAYAADVHPSKWQFQESAEGRPSLAPPFEHLRLHFNLSHTEDLVAMAVCRHVRVGIDVEKLGSVSLAVADRFFSAAEVAELRALPAETQPRRFMQLWTLKEAYLKAVGTGLAGGLGRMSFLFGTTGDFHFKRPEDADERRWQFHQYAIGAHLLGVAVLPDAIDSRLAVTFREFRVPKAASSQEQCAQP
jgi:4'-phosphopantetheinyl transferase